MKSTGLRTIDGGVGAPTSENRLERESGPVFLLAQANGNLL
jgi:hypothetical protein